MKKDTSFSYLFVVLLLLKAKQVKLEYLGSVLVKWLPYFLCLGHKIPCLMHVLPPTLGSLTIYFPFSTCQSSLVILHIQRLKLYFVDMELHHFVKSEVLQQEFNFL